MVQSIFWYVFIKNESLIEQLTSFKMQAEETLFYIHRGVLIQKSDVFRDMFSMPTGHDAPQGSSEDNPIQLPGVTSEEFNDFLCWIYKT